LISKFQETVLAICIVLRSRCDRFGGFNGIAFVVGHDVSQDIDCGSFALVLWLSEVSFEKRVELTGIGKPVAEWSGMD
jgi:hypothetical protein